MAESVSSSISKLRQGTLSFSLPPDLHWTLLGLELRGEDSQVSSWANEKGKLDTKKILSFLRQNSEVNADWNWIWKLSGHPKQIIFIWQIWWDRIPNNSNLALRIPSFSPSCCFCPNTPENSDHIFKDCPRAQEMWLKLGLPAPLNPNLNLPFKSWLKTGLTLTLNWQGNMSKCCDIAGNAVNIIVSAILGDPTTLIAGVVGGLISK
ncbi:Methionine--tRNA ligase cytoplasmic [Bienertia sinuspersici]